MLEIGKVNRLKVARTGSHGVYLTDGQGNEVLLPQKYAGAGLRANDELDVFLYTDSEDRPVATTQTPLAQRGQFAWLQVRDVTPHGAFLDWGLDKDILVPFREQARRLKKGQHCLVYLYLDDKSGRLVASSKFLRFLKKQCPDLERGQKVDLLVWETTDLGAKVIINNRCQGLIFKDDLYEELQSGQRLSGYIKNIRPDKKIDVTLQKPGFAAIEPHAQRLLLKIRQNNGFLALNDNSSPDEIREQLKISKKAFKKAVGILYKKRLIRITADGLQLADEHNQ